MLVGVLLWRFGRSLGVRWGRVAGEHLRTEPRFLELPAGEEEEHLSPAPCPSVSPRRPAGQQKLRSSVVWGCETALTETVRSTVCITGAGQCRWCSSRGVRSLFHVLPNPSAAWPCSGSPSLSKLGPLFLPDCRAAWWQKCLHQM